MNGSEKLQLSGNKLIWHQDELKKWQKEENFPCIYIEFGPTSACNHKCIHCYVQEVVKKPTFLDTKIYLRFMREIGKYGVKAIVLGGCGEPLLHPASVQAIETAVKNGVDVGILTNGVMIKEEDIPSLMENLTYIRFSINGGSAKSYSTIHRCPSSDYNKVKKIMKKCIEYRNKNKSKCTLGVYSLISDVNLLEIKDWVKEVKTMGFDYMIIKPPTPGLNGKVFVKQAELDKVKPYLKEIMGMQDKNFQVMVRTDLFEDKGCLKREYQQCLGLPFMCVVDSEGGVYSCNWFWGNEKFKYGDLNKQAFQEIWEGEKKKEIIKKVTSSKFNFDKCGECRQNNLNKWLWKLKTGEIKLEKPIGEPPMHINFI
ncbi:MAG: radical SAM protein [Nanoarchaeota archaeon]